MNRIVSFRALQRLPSLLRAGERWPVFCFGFNHPLHQRLLTTSQTCLSTSQPSQTGETGYHEEPSAETRHRARMYSIAAGAACAFFGASYILYLQLRGRADEGASDEQTEDSEGENKEEESEEPKEKEHVSFHDRSVMAYEDRIRAYSTPDKIFRYFATLRVKGEDGSRNIYMTPKDFIRSITPGMMQPQEWGLDLYRTVTMDTVVKEGLGQVEDPNSVFNRLGHQGLISFSDFLFLLTILATPMKNFELAFKMFDLNGDGEVEFEEFETVRAVLRNSTAMGSRHRDHVINGNVASSVGGALAEHFFGPNKDQKLTIDQFQEFHSHLNTEILQMEFYRFKPVDDHITERDFARMVLSHASISDQKKKQMIRRARKKYGREANPGISMDEVKLFDELMGSLPDIDTALGMYYAAGASITPAELKQACKAVTGLTISDHLLDVLFTLFDENNDGELSKKEFVHVLKSRNSRGLQKPRELGFAKLVNSVLACSNKSIKNQLGIES